MKFLIFFALAFAKVSAKNLYSPSIEVPVLENEGRITKAQTASPEQFKYMVGLDFAFTETLIWCGGSLIGETWVLTCAHCTINAVSVEVFLGATICTNAEKVYNVTPTDIIPHPVYSPSPSTSDIAVIRIPATNTSSNIGIVRIPNNDDEKYLGKSVVVTGWGQTESGEASDDLKFAKLKVSPGHLCSQQFALSYNDDKAICVATPDEVSPCHGDSGGPLVLRRRNLQIGVLSLGDTGNCMNKIPLSFTRVSAYRLWIMVRTGIRGD